MLQSAVLIFISDCASFAGPVLLQQLLEYLEDRSSIGEFPLMASLYSPIAERHHDPGSFVHCTPFL